MDYSRDRGHFGSEGRCERTVVAHGWQASPHSGHGATATARDLEREPRRVEPSHTDFALPPTFRGPHYLPTPAASTVGECLQGEDQLLATDTNHYRHHCKAVRTPQLIAINILLALIVLTFLNMLVR